MKIKSRVTGEVIDVPEDAATVLTEAGIYEPVNEPDTTVEPLKTTDSPLVKKRGR